MILPILKPVSGRQKQRTTAQSGTSHNSISAEQKAVTALPRSFDEYVNQRIVFEEDGEDDG